MAVALAGWYYVILFALIWLGFLKGWSLGIIAGHGRDWYEKFKPSGWVLSLINPRNIHVYHCIGMAIRSLCFVPAIFWVHTYNFIPYVVLFVLGWVASYAIGGLMQRHIKALDSWGTRIAEMLSACVLYGVLGGGI
jgi:hypothetical protein